MYENVQVLPEQSRKDERSVDVTVMVKERPMHTTEVLKLVSNAELLELCFRLNWIGK